MTMDWLAIGSAALTVAFHVMVAVIVCVLERRPAPTDEELERASMRSSSWPSGAGGV
jgi:hypothetical protein